jgi:hypothetical protein
VTFQQVLPTSNKTFLIDYHIRQLESENGMANFHLMEALWLKIVEQICNNIDGLKWKLTTRML